MNLEHFLLLKCIQEILLLEFSLNSKNVKHPHLTIQVHKWLLYFVKKFLLQRSISTDYQNMSSLKGERKIDNPYDKWVLIKIYKS